MSGSALYKTKLCNLYKNNGHCSKPNCTFAHGVAELRHPGESSSFTGKGISFLPFFHTLFDSIIMFLSYSPAVLWFNAL